MDSMRRPARWRLPEPGPPGGPWQRDARTTAMPLPGHTPGRSPICCAMGMPALLWGEALRSAARQADDPETGVVFDLDPAMAAATRWSIQARAASGGWIVGGGHVPGSGGLVEAGRGFSSRRPDGGEGRREEGRRELRLALVTRTLYHVFNGASRPRWCRHPADWLAVRSADRRRG